MTRKADGSAWRPWGDVIEEGDAIMDIGITGAEGKPGVNVVRISGRLDAATYEAAQPVIMDALEKGADGMILNMASLDFVSSAGLRIMIIVLKKAAADGKRVAMVDVQPQIYKIFKIAALDKVFRFFENEDEALREMWP
jgi:stage II sporulation protein AA (anti-sigma F factor antagonist)